MLSGCLLIIQVFKVNVYLCCFFFQAEDGIRDMIPSYLVVMSLLSPFPQGAFFYAVCFLKKAIIASDSYSQIMPLGVG